MYKVTKKFGHDRGYSCAFRQWNAQSNCKYIHGYSLAFEVGLSSNQLNEQNWVYDFGNFNFFLFRSMDFSKPIKLFLLK